MIQLEGPITINAVDYSDEIAHATIRRRRNLTTKRPTFGNARSVQKAGSIVEEFEIECENDVAAAKLWLELYDAIDTDTGELEVVARMKEAVVGTDNPSFTFNIVVTGVEIGGTPGDQNYQRHTFPITEDGITKATGA